MDYECRYLTTGAIYSFFSLLNNDQDNHAGCMLRQQKNSDKCFVSFF
ncbi:hypothetical protein CHK_1361 [Christensenella hongkongensis]|uniref:Uncharacterized protein n=1 Tax=Christensenella hongkongensis TaxID=270498 RepID=A0A0M2NEM2_9FIRM|nr:hypothetical protein CHK_1361 [Christensenella hongkongensis]